jgi:hypothetical protein
VAPKEFLPKKIDLSAYDIRDALQGRDLYFRGNYALIVIRNTNGTNYFTLIDKSGVQQFEPIECGNDSDPPVWHSDGVITVANSSGATVYDEKGNRLFSTSYSPMGNPKEHAFGYTPLLVFSEGLAPVREGFYIDKQGNRVIG